MPNDAACAREEGGGGVSRRSFLTVGAAVLGGAISAVLGASGLSYFVSPAFKKDEEDWVDIAKASDIKPGMPVKVDFVARKRDAWVVTEKRSSAWVLSDGKEFTVFDPRCTHLGCPYRWDASKLQFLCPCHAAVFDGKGAVVSGPPPRPLDRYAAKVVAGRLLIQPQAMKGAA
ncbi:MAG: ubiquinol-cytochrome c reductase iron-sulfur subunit [Elusimicrobia bacterium]|nr:ubiquinol-cytochrome c reductase iron-sulfur subunit [Elusimicrobiota bacterium]